MFYQCWAKEEERATIGESNATSSNLKILNYAPGALETNMTCQLRHEEKLDPKLQSIFRESHENKTLISPEDSARRMVNLLWKNDFESGSHIDYWDLSND